MKGRLAVPLPLRRLLLDVCLAIGVGVSTWSQAAAFKDNPASDGETPARTDACGDPVPTAALQRLGTIRLRHGGSIISLIFSPNSRLLASVGADNTLRLWDVATSKEIHRLPENWACCAAFSPDGKLLGSGSAIGAVRLWEVATGKELRPCCEGHRGKVTALA